MKSEILIINDMCGYGKVATAAMLPVLSYLGIRTFNLPTAIVSNNLEYGKFNILDTTDYMAGVFPIWKQLGFSFGAIATGFIASDEQASLLAEWCSEQALNGTIIFVDPIMGDEGKLYNGVTTSTISSMRRMISIAHLIVPNYTEACYLTDTSFTNTPLAIRDAYALVDKLRKVGSRSVVITSMNIEGNFDSNSEDTSPSASTKAVVGYNYATGEYFCLPYTEIPVRFPGTGDIFSSVLYGHLLNGESLEASTQKAMDVVAQLIFLCKDQKDKFRGIPIEKYLSLIS